MEQDERAPLQRSKDPELSLFEDRRVVRCAATNAIRLYLTSALKKYHEPRTELRHSEYEGS